MGLGLFLLQYRRMVLAIWGGNCLPVVEIYRLVLGLVVAKVVERMVELLPLGLGV